MRFIVLASCLLLNGCFFFYVPGSAVSAISDTLTGSFGNMCIPESAKIGDQLKQPDGKAGTVQRISGPSSQCNGPYPIRAQVSFN